MPARKTYEERKKELAENEIKAINRQLTRLMDRYNEKAKPLIERRKGFEAEIAALKPAEA